MLLEQESIVFKLEGSRYVGRGEISLSFRNLKNRQPALLISTLPFQAGKANPLSTNNSDIDRDRC
jgi:hypothetical protein